jgi:hypothetical protein
MSSHIATFGFYTFYCLGGETGIIFLAFAYFIGFYCFYCFYCFYESLPLLLSNIIYDFDYSSSIIILEFLDVSSLLTYNDIFLFDGFGLNTFLLVFLAKLLIFGIFLSYSPLKLPADYLRFVFKFIGICF